MCDISFFIDKVQQESQWIPRCKIYELQMMGVMENEASDARIPRLHLNNYGKTLVEIMDEYDSAFQTDKTHTQASTSRV